ncbi:unnamed protein product [Urochloa humidicola]
MASLESGQGSDAAGVLNLPRRVTPVSRKVINYFCECDLSIVGKVWSDLADLPLEERVEALEKSLEEFELKQAPLVLSSDSEEDDDENDDDDEEVGDKEDEGTESLKLMDDGKKPRDEPLNEFERGSKKPKLAEAIECHGQEA